MKLFIIKIGGNVIDDERSLSSFLESFAAIKDPKVLVHGGGKVATRIGEQLGIQSVYVEGRRITDAATLDLVTMVYGGLVNKKITAALQALGCNAIGLTGADANSIPAVKRPAGETDYGFAGDIESDRLRTESLRLFIAHGLVPVFAPLTHNGAGQLLNTNADTIAAALAAALSKDYTVRLLYCFEKKGVLRDVTDENSVIHLIDTARYEQLLQENALAGGILPKLENAFAACRHGVGEVLIGDAADLLQNCTDEVAGTLIRI